MKRGKRFLGTLLAMVLLVSTIGFNAFAAEKTNLCTTFDETAGIFVGEFIGGDIDGTDILAYDKIPAEYCFAYYVHYMMMREDLLEDYIEYVAGESYRCSIPYAVFEAKAKSIADYSGDFKRAELGLYDSASDCMVFTQEEFSSSAGHPAFVIGYTESGNTYDIYIQRMQIGFETLEEMEVEFGEYYDDYDREKDVFVDEDGYYHLVHRNIFYKLTATYSNGNIYYKAVEKLSSVDGISMIKRGEEVTTNNNNSLLWYKDGCSVRAEQGVFPDGAIVSIEKVTSGALFLNAQNALADIANKMFVYEINATDNNIKIQPKGTVNMTVEIPKDYDLDSVAVFYVSPEGKAEKLGGEVDKKNFTIDLKLTHFSTYVVAEMKDAAVVAPKTADGNEMTGQMTLWLMSGVAIALIVYDKKRRYMV